MYDQEIGFQPQQWKYRGGDQLHMAMRVFVSSTAEVHCRICLNPEFLRIESRVLTCKHERWRQAAIAQRMGEGGQLNGLRPGPDDQPYVGETQPSP